MPLQHVLQGQWTRGRPAAAQWDMRAACSAALRPATAHRVLLVRFSDCTGASAAWLLRPQRCGLGQPCRPLLPRVLLALRACRNKSDSKNDAANLHGVCEPQHSSRLFPRPRTSTALLSPPLKPALVPLSLTASWPGEKLASRACRAQKASAATSPPAAGVIFALQDGVRPGSGKHGTAGGGA